MAIREHVFRSTVTGIVLGGVPCILIAATEDIPRLWKFLDGLKPPPIVLKYLVVLYALYLALSGLILWLKKKDADIPRWLLSAHSFWGGTGHALQGVLLAIAGGLFVSLPPILVVKPVSLSVATVILRYSLAVAAVVASCGMAAAKDYVESRLHL